MQFGMPNHIEDAVNETLPGDAQKMRWISSNIYEQTIWNLNEVKAIGKINITG